MHVQAQSGSQICAAFIQLQRKIDKCTKTTTAHKHSPTTHSHCV